MTKVILLVLIFYILAMIQASFLVHFQIFGMVLNVSLLLVVLINIFENPHKYLGLWASLISGFFLDIFSTRPFGFWILIFFLAAIFVKIILPLGKSFTATGLSLLHEIV